MIAVWLLGGVETCLAQEALRMSIAGAEAAEARRKAVTTIGYYNFKLGPTAWRFSAGLGMEYNDNVNLREENPEGDFIFRPSVGANMLWPITEKNTLNLTLGAGYSAYLTHPELSQIFITPGSGVSFDIYIGDFSINLHDRFSITEYAYQNPTVSRTGEYAQLENALGASALWDLNKGIVTLGYDHVNYMSLTSNQRTQDGVSDVFFANAGLVFRPDMVAGVEFGTGFINYSSTNAPNATQWNAGLFYRAILSQYFNTKLNAGYTVYSPEKSGAFAGLSDTSAIYVQLEVNHRLNRAVSYSAAAGHSVNLSFYGQNYELYYVQVQPNWNIIKKLSISTPFFWEHGTGLAGYYGYSLQGEKFDRFGGGISLRRAITRKLSSGLSYQFVLRDSDVRSTRYTLDTVSLSFSYQF